MTLGLRSTEKRTQGKHSVISNTKIRIDWLPLSISCLISWPFSENKESILPNDNLRRVWMSATKVLDAKTPSDNALSIKLGSSSEARVLACPGLSAQTSVEKS